MMPASSWLTHACLDAGLLENEGAQIAIKHIVRF